MNQNALPELLAPAGSLAKLRMALAYGADAVYAGAAGFSMRPDTASLDDTALAQAVQETHAQGRKFYLALNSLLFVDDMQRVAAWLETTREIAFDAIIVSDPGAVRAVRRIRPETAVHVSTQASTANPEAAAFWRDAGAARVILARETALKDVATIVDDAGIEVEVFVHGAMCMAVSGRCLLSAHLCGSSASQGACKHSCRWEWQLVEQKRPDLSIPVFETGRETIFLGSTDLCMIAHIPELVTSGVRALKIEGRMKGEGYVATVTRVYRAALDAYAANPATYQPDPAWQAELDAVSHRPYSTGFAFPDTDPAALQTMNRPISTTQLVGIVRDTDDHQQVEVKHAFATGQTLEWIAPGAASGVTEVTGLADTQGKPIEQCHCGTHARITFADGPLPHYAVLRQRA